MQSLLHREYHHQHFKSSVTFYYMPLRHKLVIVTWYLCCLLSPKDAACHIAINLFVICGHIPVWEVWLLYLGKQSWRRSKANEWSVVGRLAACISLCNFRQAISLLWHSVFLSVKLDLARWSQKPLLCSRIWYFCLKEIKEKATIDFCGGQYLFGQEITPLWEEEQAKSCYLAGPGPDVPIYLPNSGRMGNLSDDSQPFQPHAEQNTQWDK